MHPCLFMHYFHSLLEFALKNGLHVNVDNYQELEVITEIMEEIRYKINSFEIRTLTGYWYYFMSVKKTQLHW